MRLKSDSNQSHCEGKWKKLIRNTVKVKDEGKKGANLFKFQGEYHAYHENQSLC